MGKILLVALALCASCATGCLGNRPVSRAYQNSHREAVETLFELLGMEKAHERGMEQMLAIQMEQNPQFGLFEDVQRGFFAEYMSWESLKDEFIAVFMEEFSEGEIRELIAFYSTPTGRKTIRKMPVLLSKGSRIQTRLLQEKMPELERMIREEADSMKAGRDGRNPAGPREPL